MTTTRILPGVLVVLATAGSAFAQYGGGPGASASRYPGLIPSVAPVGYEEVGPPTGPTPGNGQQSWLTGVPPTMPPGRPPAAANPTALDRVTTPIRQTSADASDPVGTLTGQPTPPPGAGVPGMPPGSYPSPFYTDGPGCCGPLGRNGRIGYEFLSYTGPAFVFGDGGVTHRLHTGWMVGGEGRSLFFNREHDAAWVVALGLSYQHNYGDTTDPLRVFIRQQPLSITRNGATVLLPQKDLGVTAGIHGLHRTSFNFGLGRDWWLIGPGTPGLENGWNWRVGALFGGRWGTDHIDLLPYANPIHDTYARRQGISHGMFIAAHTTVEIPMGAWILFGGVRAEYGYDWTNVIPPQDGNMSSVNLLITAGIRY